MVMQGTSTYMTLRFLVVSHCSNNAGASFCWAGNALKLFPIRIKLIYQIDLS